MRLQDLVPGMQICIKNGLIGKIVDNHITISLPDENDNFIEKYLLLSDFDRFFTYKHDANIQIVHIVVRDKNNIIRYIPIKNATTKDSTEVIDEMFKELYLVSPNDIAIISDNNIKQRISKYGKSIGSKELTDYAYTTDIDSTYEEIFYFIEGRREKIFFIEKTVESIFEPGLFQITKRITDVEKDTGKTIRLFLSI